MFLGRPQLLRRPIPHSAERPKKLRVGYHLTGYPFVTINCFRLKYEKKQLVAITHPHEVNHGKDKAEISMTSD